MGVDHEKELRDHAVGVAGNGVEGEAGTGKQ